MVAAWCVILQPEWLTYDICIDEHGKMLAENHAYLSHVMNATKPSKTRCLILPTPIAPHSANLELALSRFCAPSDDRQARSVLDFVSAGMRCRFVATVLLKGCRQPVL